MKCRSRGERRLASLRKDLERLRLGSARVLARKITIRRDLPGQILRTKAKIARVSEELARRQEAA